MSITDQIRDEQKQFQIRTGILADRVHLHSSQIHEAFREQTQETIVDKHNKGNLKLLGMTVVACSVFGPSFSGVTPLQQSEGALQYNS